MRDQAEGRRSLINRDQCEYQAEGRRSLIIKDQCEGPEGLEGSLSPPDAPKHAHTVRVWVHSTFHVEFVFSDRLCFHVIAQ